MRTLLLLTVLLTTCGVRAQVFHFDDTSALLIKTVDQSPAHWYLEIQTDIAQDTVLRWKSEFVNIPNEWQISFDDQTTYHTDVQDGDSADFVLQQGLEFPQKLIIGGTLNNTPGHGIVYFDIYDPDFSTYVQRISYEFIVSPLAGVVGLSPGTGMVLENGFLSLADGETFEVTITDLSGRLFYTAVAAVHDLSSMDINNHLIRIRSRKGSTLLWLSD